MLLSAAPAQAACVVGTADVVCGTTTTTDSTYPALAPNDRHYDYVGVTTGPVTLDVTAGAIIDDYGLALTTTSTTPSDAIVTNLGSVTIDTGLTATAGGSSAVDITVTGATNALYQGTGSVTNNSLTGRGVFIENDVTGTGNLTALLGGNITNNANINNAAVAVISNGTDGNVRVESLTGTTLRSPFGGALGQITNAASDGTITVINGGTILSPSGAPNTIDYGLRAWSSGIGAVTVTNNGLIGSATDRTLVYGIDAEILNPLSAATLTVNTSATSQTWGTAAGIYANNAGTGATVVTALGVIDVSAGTGIEVDALGPVTVSTGVINASVDGVNTTTTTGNTIVNVTGNVVAGDDGVDATATTGTIAVNVTGGNITATDDGIDLSNTNATATAQTVTVAAGRTVSAGSNAIESTLAVGGQLTVTNNGTLATTTVGGDAIFTSFNGSTLIDNNAGATITGDLDLTNGVDTVNNRGTMNSFGGSNFYDGADVITNFSGGVINLDGVVNFGAAADTFVNSPGGIINVTANSSLLNLETFTQNGRINLDTFTLTGSSGAAFADFVNGLTGFIDTNGAAGILGFDSLTNNGTMDLAGAIFTAPAGVFTNGTAGIIIADEGLTTITGQTSFVNNGVLDLLDGARNDALTINSDYTGAGRLQVDVSGTTSDLLIINGTASGITSIDVNTIGAGVFVPGGILVVDVSGASLDAFTIGNEFGGNPLINYGVEQIGNDYFLTTLLDPETAFIPLAATGLIRDIWYQSADEVRAHTLAPRWNDGVSFFAHIYGSKDKSGQSDSQLYNDVQYDADNNIETDRWGIQGGVAYGFGPARVGVTGGYENADAEGDGNFEASGWNIGLYGVYGGMTGFHAEALFKHDAYDVEFDGLFDENEVDGSSTGFEIGAGYRFPIGIVPSLDVFAGVSHVWSDLDDVSAFGFNYEYDDFTSTRGRLGIRGNFGGTFNPYLSATLEHEFDGDADVTLCQGSFCDDLNSTGKATWGRLEGGLAGGTGTYGLQLAGWVDVGDITGAGLRLGFAWGGAREVAPPQAKPSRRPAPVISPTSTQPASCRP